MKLKLVPTNIIKYNEQGNVCASLLRQTKKQYHSNLNIKNIELRFLENCKIVFSDKSSSFEKTYLIEKEWVITDDSEITQIFNQYFNKIVPDLGVKVPDALILHRLEVKDPILNAITKYQNHSSIKNILKNC